MIKKLLIILLILVVVGGIGFYVYNKNSNLLSLDSINLSSNETEIDQMSGDPIEDAMLKEVDEDSAIEMKNMTYQYFGELNDVTEGEIRGVATDGLSTGTAMSNYDGNEYILFAEFDALPDPIDDDFYEGWVVQKDPFMFISTGIVKKINGVYINAYKSGEDLTNYDFYVLTLEPNDGDPAPADHIVEGTMKITSQ